MLLIYFCIVNQTHGYSTSEPHPQPFKSIILIQGLAELARVDLSL